MFELHLFILASQFAFLSTKHFLPPPAHTQKYRPNLSSSKAPLQVNIHHPQCNRKHTHAHLGTHTCTLISSLFGTPSTDRILTVKRHRYLEQRPVCNKLICLYLHPEVFSVCCTRVLPPQFDKLSKHGEYCFRFSYTPAIFLLQDLGSTQHKRNISICFCWKVKRGMTSKIPFGLPPPFPCTPGSISQF